jgi:hypothetical protein
MTRPSPEQFYRLNLPDHLREIAQPIAEIANRIAVNAPVNSDSEAALAALKEAQDLALRSFLPTDAGQIEMPFGELAGPAFEADHHCSLDPG